jgi:hypothetical protein
MPEYSNYLEGLPAVVGALDGTEIIGASKDGDPVGLTAQQIADLGGSGEGTVTSVAGTTNRITSTGGATPVIDIAAAYDAAITSAINAKVADAINDGTTSVAPSQNAVFDALALKAPLAGSKVLVVACSDELSLLSAGINKIRFRMPYAMTLTAVRASLTTAQPSGASIFTVDINESGSTILSTKITIDNTEKTSTTAATPPVISDASLADDAEMSVDIDLIGDAGATGLKITLIGS